MWYCEVLIRWKLDENKFKEILWFEETVGVGCYDVNTGFSIFLFSTLSFLVPSLARIKWNVLYISLWVMEIPGLFWDSTHAWQPVQKCSSLKDSF